MVSGPGVIHAIAGLANARENCWPMILLGGASDSMQDGTGAFQEYPQLESCRLHCKYAARVDSVERIPYFVQQAVWHSITGRPGPVYLDLPGNFLIDVPAEGAVIYPPRCPDPPQYQADPSEIAKAVAALKSAKRPLIIVGKGASYGYVAVLFSPQFTPIAIGGRTRRSLPSSTQRASRSCLRRWAKAASPMITHQT